MRFWDKGLLLALFVIGLTSCKDVVYTQPYLIGTFTGTYQPDGVKNPEDLPNFPVVIKSQLTDVKASRYTFEGTAELNGKTYKLTGFEVSPDGDVIYLAPQARGIFGNFVMMLQDEAGVDVSICGSVYYGLAGARLPPTTHNGRIISGNTDSVEACYASGEGVGSFYGLEKQ